MKFKMLKFVPLMVIALLFVGCATTDKAEDEPATVIETDASTTDRPGMDREGADITGADKARPWTGHPLEDPDSLLYTKVIHFDFDRSEIKPEWRDVVVAHGNYLAQNPTARVTIEGHCDERGSREYNIGLGERRANAVKQILLAQGATLDQITTISYGEEQPVAYGSDEVSWAQNRRAVFVY